MSLRKVNSSLPVTSSVTSKHQGAERHPGRQGAASRPLTSSFSILARSASTKYRFPSFLSHSRLRLIRAAPSKVCLRVSRVTMGSPFFQNPMRFTSSAFHCLSGSSGSPIPHSSRVPGKSTSCCHPGIMHVHFPQRSIFFIYPPCICAESVFSPCLFRPAAPSPRTHFSSGFIESSRQNRPAPDWPASPMCSIRCDPVPQIPDTVWSRTSPTTRFPGQRDNPESGL